MWIAEPATALTDYLLTAECLILGLRLHQAGQCRGADLWVWGFLALGAAALAGGSFHGFRPAVSPGLANILWNASMVLIGVAAGFMISGVLVSALFDARQWLWAGLFVSVGAGVLLAMKIGIHRNFNHNDLFHSVMLIALYCLYRGALLLREPGSYVR